MSRLLLEAPIGRLYLHYLVPTVFATLVTAIYLFADTVMVGHWLGAEALAALNLIVPLEFGYFAIGSLLGNGGAVCFTRCLSLGRTEEAQRYFALSILTGGVIAGVLTVLSLLFLRPMATFLLGAGPEGPLLEATLDYGIYIAMGCPAFLMSTLLAPFLRHDQAPRRAMCGVLAGGVLNIFLDWLFMYCLGMGLGGASLATMLGASLTVLVMASHFLKRQRALRWRRPVLRLLPTIGRFGGGAFLQELSGCATVLLFNHLALGMLGETGLIIYGVVANDLLVMAALFNGVAQSAQPLTAANFAARQLKRVRQGLLLALSTAGGLGLTIACFGGLFPEVLMKAFLSGETLAALPREAVVAVSVGMRCLPFMGLGQVSSLLLPALGAPMAGMTFSLLRNGALLLPVGLLLGLLVTPWSIWWAFLVAEAALLPFLFVMLRRAQRAQT